MRHVRPLPLAILSAILVAVAACTTAAPGWTYFPAPTGSPGSSGGASGSPAASPGSVLIKISALGVKYEQAAVVVPASTPFQIQFDNKDAGVQHNVTVHQGGPTGPELFKGEIFSGVGTRVYDIGALDPGAYSFACTVHPTMTGTLTAQ